MSALDYTSVVPEMSCHHICLGNLRLPIQSADFPDV